MNLDRLKELFASINSVTDDSMGDGINRLAYTPHDKKARELFKKECENAGLDVREDSVGNIFARRKGGDDTLAPVAFGSHLDTVVNGGEFDGILGVLAGLELMRSLNDEHISTKRALELIVFACEESSRFNISTLGSKVLSKKLSSGSLTSVKDYKSRALSDIFLEFGLDVSRVDSAADDFKAPECFFELHIEQGPLLDNEKIQIGIVSAIAAPLRFRLDIAGEAQHSGTTALKYRHDALCAAAEIILGIENIAKEMAENGVVATVGECKVAPGVMNVVPASASLLVDLRGISKEDRALAYERIIHIANEVSSRRGTTYKSTLLAVDEPVVLDGELVNLISQSAKELELSHVVMPSGAGHDSMHMADLCPTGMIFVPSKGGVSHNPAEHTDWADIMAGVRLLRDVVLKAANS